jgi:protein phosphatase
MFSFLFTHPWQREKAHHHCCGAFFVIPADHAHLHVAASTHPGMKGKNNEDQYAVSAYKLSEADATPSLLAIISDGIGGHRAGEVASQIAVETISHIVAESDGSKPSTTLRAAIIQASQAIFTQAEAHPDKRGMGATCVCAWIIGSRLYTASIGDSRLYLLRGSSISQLTTDHTWIQEAIEYGALTPEQARGHPNAHIIRRYLGSQLPPEVDFRMRLNPTETDGQAQANQGFLLIPGDFLILCSDGLTDLVDKDEIKLALLSSNRDQAVQELTRLANERGGHDNITIVLLEVPGSDVATQVSQVRHRAPRRRWLLFILILLGGSLLLALILTMLGGIWLLSRPAATLTPISNPTSTYLLVFPTQTQPSPLETSTPVVSTSMLVTKTAWPTNALIAISTSSPVPSPSAPGSP